MLAIVLLIALVWTLARFGPWSSENDDADQHIDNGSSQSAAPPDDDAPADDAPVDGDDEQPDEPDDVADAPADNASVAQEIRELIDSLTVVRGQSAIEYDRGLFGQAWFDEDRNGCDTRNDILGRDLHNVEFKEGTNDCKVLAGTLDDWYSGETVEFVSGQDTSRLVQIDHVVALSWAWHHGADEWNDERRRQFANDPLNLVATTDSMNQSKSDHGPSRWLPADDAVQCRYVQHVTQILIEYDLGIGLRDRAMMRGVLDECANSDAFGVFAEPRA